MEAVVRTKPATQNRIHVKPLDRRQFLAAAAATCAAVGMARRTAAAASPPWAMRLSFSSVMLAALPIEEVCERANRLGFEAIDIWCPFDNCNHLADVVSRLGPEGLKELLAKHHLSLASFTTYTTKKEAVGFPAYADFIGKFGGGVVVRESKYIQVKPEDLKASMRNFFEQLKPQIEKAAETKVRLAVENHGDALLGNPDSFKAFVDLNPAPEHVGLAVAPYHLQNIKASVEDVIRTAGSQLRFFYAWQSARGMNQLPGHGPADFHPWLKALEEVNYQGYVHPFMHGSSTPENLTAGIAKAVQYLKDCRQRPTGE